MKETEVIQHTQIDGLRIFFNTMDYRTPHTHKEIELIFVLENNLVIPLETQNCVVQPGEIIVFNMDQTHEFYKQNESCTFLCFQISPSLVECAFPWIENIKFKELKLSNAFDTSTYNYIQNELLSIARTYFEQPNYYELYCIGKTYLVLHELFTKTPYEILTQAEATERQRRNSRLNRLLEFVDENYMHKIRLQDFASIEGLSMSYLSHFVKETLNQSFQEYVRAVRFHAACKMISSGQQKMLDVCLASGFSDYRYFSSTFQQLVGVTPEQYSRQVQNLMPEETKIHHSLHSLERFYSRKKSLELINKYEILYK